MIHSHSQTQSRGTGPRRRTSIHSCVRSIIRSLVPSVISQMTRSVEEGGPDGPGRAAVTAPPKCQRSKPARFSSHSRSMSTRGSLGPLLCVSSSLWPRKINQPLPRVVLTADGWRVLEGRSCDFNVLAQRRHESLLLTTHWLELVARPQLLLGVLVPPLLHATAGRGRASGSNAVPETSAHIPLASTGTCGHPAARQSREP